MLYYQLPPRGFWFWWCDGLQVHDALVVALWVGINVLYVEQRTSLVMALYKGEQLTHCQTICSAFAVAVRRVSLAGRVPSMSCWVLHGRGLPRLPPWQDANILPGVLGKVRLCCSLPVSWILPLGITVLDIQGWGAQNHNPDSLHSFSGALGWAATLDIMLLFLPVPRSTFLHYLLGSGFSSLMKYHRWGHSSNTMSGTGCLYLVMTLAFGSSRCERAV